MLTNKPGIDRLLRRILDRLYLAAGVLAATCLVAITVLVSVQIAARWFGFLFPAVEDFAGFLMAAATFLALAWTQRHGDHIRVTLVIRKLPPGLRRWQEAAVLFIVLLLAVKLSWSAIVFVLESLEFGDVASGHVAVPLWIPQLPMAVGLIVFTIALADEFITALSRKNHHD